MGTKGQDVTLEQNGNSFHVTTPAGSRFLDLTGGNDQSDAMDLFAGVQQPSRPYQTNRIKCRFY